MSSILTNNGAMVALQTMKSINKNMSQIQSEISTGKSVANAKDNAAVWAISKVMESDVKGFKGIADSLALGSSTVAVGRIAAETVTKLLTEIKGKIVASQEENMDRTKIQTDIDELTRQIFGTVDGAQFNGLNLVNGTATNPVQVLSSLNRASDGTVTAARIDVATVDLTVTGALATLDTIDVSSTTTAATALTDIEALLQTSIEAAANFGSSQKRIDIQRDFVGELSDALKSGIGSLVDANMEEASARLQALQVQQQLATQSLSIANQAPQNILALFR